MGLGSVTGNIEKAVIIFENNGTKKKIDVQYNPSSISFTTYAHDTELGDSQDDGGSTESTHQNTSVASIGMKVDLIFDDVNNFDAFMNEKITVSTGMAASAISKAVGISSEISKIFAFIERINCSENRQITFQWSDFCFQGELTSVSTELNMFNVMGNPIRGKVSLSIQQDYSAEEAGDKENNRAFDNLFGGAMFTSSSTDAKSLKDKAGNLLNLNIF